MKVKLLGMVMLLFISTCCLLNASPLDTKEIPSSAKWLLHIDVEQLLKSKLGDIIKETSEIPEVKLKLNGLEAATSFNIVKDLKAVTVWGGEDPETTAVVVMHGKFDKAKLTAIIKALDGFQEMKHNAHSYYTWKDKGANKQQFGGFIGERAIFISPSAEAVKMLLDITDGKGSNLSENSSFSKWSSSNSDFIVLGSVDGLGKLQGVSPHAAILKNVNNAYLSIRENGDKIAGKVLLETEKTEIANQMSQAGMGLKALATMSSQKNPLQKAVVDSIQIKTIGKKVEATFSCPVKLLKELFEKKKDEFLGGKIETKVEAF